MAKTNTFIVTCLISIISSSSFAAKPFPAWGRCWDGEAASYQDARNINCPCAVGTATDLAIQAASAAGYSNCGNGKSAITKLTYGTPIWKGPAYGYAYTADCEVQVTLTCYKQ